MNQHTAFNYKFLIYDPLSGTEGEIRHNYPDAYTGGPVGVDVDKRFNYPFWFREGRAGNLYSFYHYIDDPRLPSSLQFDFTFTFKYNCSQLADFSFDKTIRLVKGGAVVFGKVNELQVDHTKKTITVNGEV